MVVFDLEVYTKSISMKPRPRDVDDRHGPATFVPQVFTGMSEAASNPAARLDRVEAVPGASSIPRIAETSHQVGAGEFNRAKTPLSTFPFSSL